MAMKVSEYWGKTTNRWGSVRFTTSTQLPNIAFAASSSVPELKGGDAARIQAVSLAG
ncbi:MAG: hypothetical protein ACSLE5_06555 [Porticoccaceae bacterium]